MYSTNFKLDEDDLIELEQIFIILDRLLEEYGVDHVNNKSYKPISGMSCYYLDDDDCPNCIIGHVMVANNWTIDEIKKVEGSTPAVGLCSDEEHHQHDRIYELWRQKFRMNTLYIMSTIQRLQDLGWTWCVAIHGGKEKMIEHMWPEDVSRYHARLRLDVLPLSVLRAAQAR